MAPPGRSRYGNCGGWGYQNDGLGDPARAIGLLHVGARYLDPAIGRFVQRDPLSIYDGWNVYVYGGNQPSLVLDPSGREGLNNVIMTIFVAVRILAGVAGQVLKAGSKIAPKQLKDTIVTWAVRCKSFSKAPGPKPRGWGPQPKPPPTHPGGPPGPPEPPKPFGL